MLKKITKWETEDGKVFDTQEEAEEYMFEQEKEVMTHHTEADRAEFEGYALSVGLSLRTAGFGYYEKLETCSAWAAWQAARRAPAAPVQQGDAYSLIDRFLRNNLDDSDYAEYSTALDALAAALQPPDAFQTEGGLKSEIRTTTPSVAPVQMPEPIAYLHECGKKPSLRTLEFSKVAIQLSSKGYKSHGLYTEQQVTDLLKSVGVSVKL